MSRNQLSLPVQSNSKLHSTFRDRVIKARKLRDCVVTTQGTGRADLDIVDNPFHKMMRDNRGVL
jgi:hypothetical protein